MNRDRSHLSIRTKTTLFVVLALGVLTALMGAIQFRSSLTRVQQIESDQAIAHSQRVDRQLDNSLADLGGTNVDWARWDDSFEFVQDGNEEFRQTHLFAEAFKPIGIDLIAFVNNDGVAIYQAWYADDGERDVPAGLLSLVQPGAVLGDFSSDPNTAPGGLVAADGTVFLVTSRAIVPSMRAIAPAGVLLMARTVSEAFTTEVAELVNLDLSVQPCDNDVCAGFGTEPQILKTATTVTSRAVVRAIDGTPALRTEVTAPRNVYQESRDGIQRVLLILVAVGVGAIVVTIAGLRLLIIDPLERLGLTVSAVARTNDPSLRATAGRSDEIGDLAAGVNVMLARLENSQGQLVEAKQHVEETSAAKSRFLSRVSHELRTPINGVLAYAQLLQLDHEDGESREYADRIVTAARHITALVDEFLDIARIEAGAIPIHIESIDPKAIAAEVIEMTSPLAAAQEISIELSGPDDARALADPLRLRQSILNLVSNAIKYGQSETPIAVMIGARGLETVIEVRDHGVGIPGDQLHRLFVPFDRLSADSTDEVGSGVGLSVTRQLVELMGGTVDVTSEVGVGTTFTVTLPASAEVPEVPISTNACDGVPASGELAANAAR